LLDKPEDRAILLRHVGRLRENWQKHGEDSEKYESEAVFKLFGRSRGPQGRTRKAASSRPGPPSYEDRWRKWRLEKPKADRKSNDDLGLVGESKAIRELRSRIRKAAQKDSTVLIQGPTGTGKELVADAIRRESNRRDKPFEKVNCGGIPEALLESDLFGHEKGAFTGAVTNKKGRFEQAKDGTIFLDEIGNLSFSSQAKILRVLENGEFQPLGSNETKQSKARILAATNKDLQEEIKEGHFRDDLFYRLSQFPIYTQALAKRPEDLVVLTNHFIDQGNLKVEARAKFLLYAYDFPGNVRRLESLLQLDYGYLREELLREWAKRAEIGSDRCDRILEISSSSELEDVLGSLIKPEEVQYKKEEEDQGGDQAWERFAERWDQKNYGSSGSSVL
jgi:DNA-binding NtrC family response regulator